MTAPLLPHAPRPGQAEAMAWLSEQIANRQHSIWEASTGLGKTVAAMAAVNKASPSQADSCLFAVRTLSQQRQVWLEWRALRQNGASGTLVPLVGRRHACPFLREREGAEEASPEDLGKMCRKAKDLAVSDPTSPDACPSYRALLALTDDDGSDEGSGLQTLEASLHATDVEDPTTWIQHLESQGICAYESSKLLLPNAKCVVAPFVYVLDHGLRDALFSWWQKSPSDVALIVDEAHNFPRAARDSYALEWSQTRHNRCIREAERWGNPLMAGRIPVMQLLGALARSITNLQRGYVKDGPDARIPTLALEEELLEDLQISSPTLDRVLLDLLDHSEKRKDALLAQGRIPQSPLGGLARFLAGWFRGRDGPFAQFVGNEPQLRSALLDARIALDWVHHLRATVHMSGTLSPLDRYASEIGIPGAQTRTDVAPWLAKQLRIHIAEDVTRKYLAHQQDPMLVEKHVEWVQQILARGAGNAALFFPSYQMLHNWLEEGRFEDWGIPYFLEEPGTSLPELEQMLVRFRAASGRRLLVGVLGGRLAEGLDFPGQLLAHVLILGVPYPPPTPLQEAMAQFFELQAPGQGFQMTVSQPAIRKMRQAIGRAVRGPEDHAHVWILDARAFRFVAEFGAVTGISNHEQIAEELAKTGEIPDSGGFKTADTI